VCRLLMGLFRERGHPEGLGVDGRVLLRGIFSKWDERTWTGLNWLRRQVVSTCKRGKEPSGSIKCR
jgi:hypothetical protein